MLCTKVMASTCTKRIVHEAVDFGFAIYMREHKCKIETRPLEEGSLYVRRWLVFLRRSIGWKSQNESRRVRIRTAQQRCCKLCRRNDNHSCEQQHQSDELMLRVFETYSRGAATNWNWRPVLWTQRWLQIVACRFAKTWWKPNFPHAVLAQTFCKLRDSPSDREVMSVRSFEYICVILKCCGCLLHVHNGLVHNWYSHNSTPVSEKNYQNHVPFIISRIGRTCLWLMSNSSVQKAVLLSTKKLFLDQKILKHFPILHSLLASRLLQSKTQKVWK